MIGQSGPTARRRVDRVLEHRDEIDAFQGERTAFVEPGQEQQIVDEHLHARGLDPDATHDPSKVGGTLVRAALEELGVGGDRAQRSPQLMRRIGDEPAQLLLGRGAARERILDVAEHGVERRAEPPDLGPIVLGHPQAQVAAGDVRCRRLDVAQRTQAQPDQPQAHADRRDQRRRGDEELDDEQLVQGPVGLVERQRDEEHPATGELLDPHPKLGAVAPRVHGQVPNRPGRIEPGDAGRELGHGRGVLTAGRTARHGLVVHVAHLDVRARSRRGEGRLVGRVLEELR